MVWRDAIHTLDLGPVVGWLIVALIVVRTVVALSLRDRRRTLRDRGMREHAGLREEVLEWLDSGLLAILLVFLVVRPFIAQVMDVSSKSMEPTLRGSKTPQIDGPNDRILVNKYLLRCRPPRRGEVIVFDPPPQVNEDGPVVKRVIGLPGDTIEIDLTGQLLVNGTPQREPYLREASNLPFPKREVPAHSYFVLGDNRNHSADSSRWPDNPFLPAYLVRGKALAICWPPDRMRLLP